MRIICMCKLCMYTHTYTYIYTYTHPSACACHLGAQETEAESLICHQPRLHDKTLFQEQGSREQAVCGFFKSSSCEGEAGRGVVSSGIASST